MSTPIRRICFVCARTARGHAVAPPSSEMNSLRLMWSMALPPPSVRPSRSLALGGNVDPQKHDQENHDRIEHDPDDVGSRMPSLRYNLLVHGGKTAFRSEEHTSELQSACRR